MRLGAGPAQRLGFALSAMGASLAISCRDDGAERCYTQSMNLEVGESVGGESSQGDHRKGSCNNPGVSC